MKNIFLLFMLGSGAATVCSSAESVFTEISRIALGDSEHVFEIVRGEISLGLPFLKRIEVGKDSVVFMIRNESQKVIAPKITAEFFNRYGMRICVVEGRLDQDVVQPGGVGVKQFGLIYPELEDVFKNSTVQLPLDWKALRFVRLDGTSRVDQNPLSGAEKFQGENAAGLAANIAGRLDNARDVPEKIDGVKDSKQFEGATSLQPAIDPRRPRPRPQAVKTQQVRPAIITEQRIGTTNVGLTSIDAKFSQYGAYLQRMIDSVQIQWERIILQMAAMPAGGSTVSVKFVMNDDGKITSIKAIESNASETGSRACVSAITDRSPFGPWTDDMKAVLGTQQEMTFTFFYQ